MLSPSVTPTTLPDQAHPRAGSTSRQPTRTNARAFRFIGLPLEDRPQELHCESVEPGHLALPGPGHMQSADSFGLEPLLYRGRIWFLVQVDVRRGLPFSLASLMVSAVPPVTGPRVMTRVPCASSMFRTPDTCS